MNVREAVEVINSACGRAAHTPLVMLATCQFEEKGNICGSEFPMLPQDFNRAVEHGHPHICPLCRPKYHRNKRRKKYK